MGSPEALPTKVLRVSPPRPGYDSEWDTQPIQRHIHHTILTRLAPLNRRNTPFITTSLIVRPAWKFITKIAAHEVGVDMALQQIDHVSENERMAECIDN